MLVVEDDPAVRLLVIDVLQMLGYQTLEAADGNAAIRILESATAVDMLVTDVGLPGMNGRQLADVARQQYPGLPVLFMTGYARQAASPTSSSRHGHDQQAVQPGRSGQAGQRHADGARPTVNRPRPAGS